MSRLQLTHGRAALCLAFACTPILAANAQSPSGAWPVFRGDAAHAGIASARAIEGQGGVLWRAHTGSAVRSSPAVTATRVFVGSGDGTLYAFDRASGRTIWRFEAGDPVDASPTVARGLVLAATLSGRIFAVDETTGRLRWSMHAGAHLPLNVSPAGNWDMFASSPAVAGDRVIIGAGDGNVYALQLTTGHRLWTHRTNGRVRATAAIRDGVAIVGSFDGRVYALDLATGAERWVHRTVGDTLDSKKWGFDRRAIQSSAALSERFAFLGSRDDGLYAIDIATGERKWRVSHRGSWVVGSPATRDGRVYVGSSDGHFVQAVDAESGRELWHLRSTENHNSSPVLVGNTLYIGGASTSSPQGDLVAIDATTGVVRWRLALGGHAWSSPSVADGDVFIGTDAGDVIAVRATSDTPARLAVFYDSTLARPLALSGSRLAFEYFRDAGYQPLGADSLHAFLAARIADGAPSAIVFASDILPANVASVPADTVLFRRYLDAGGKAVWLGQPALALVLDSAGSPIGMNFSRTERLLGMPTSSLDFDQTSAHPTDAGKRWGVTEWKPGHFVIATSAVTIPLATDELKTTTAWVRVYRPERPGSGFVQLWGFGATADRLPIIRSVAEYGILRVAATRAEDSRATGGAR